MFWGMPQLGEILFTLSTGLGGPISAAVLGWLIGFFSLIGCFAWINAHLGARPAAVGVASLVSGLTLAASLGWAYVDWIAMMFGLCLLILLAASFKEPGNSYLVPIGVFSGFALSTKYSAGVVLIAALGVLLFSRENSTLKMRMKSVLQVAGPAVLVSLPWWIKNFWHTGNPFYPFFYPSGTMNALRQALYQNQPVWGDWLDTVLLPWRSTLFGVEGAPGYAASIGPLLIGLASFFWVKADRMDRSSRRVLFGVFGFSLTTLLVWAVAGRVSGLLVQSRLYFAAFPALAFLAGAGFSALSAIAWPGVRIHRILSVLIILVTGLTLVQLSTAALKSGALRYLLALEGREDYLVNNLGMAGLVFQAVDELPQGSQIVMLWEPRGFYCEPRCDSDEILDRWFSDLHRFGSASRVAENWREQGVSHVLYNRQGAGFFRRDPRFFDEGWSALDDFLAEQTILVDFDGIYTLYELKP
jgi:4-amino-4-deoxy-L-arabinose transferase-like glycosyltransferase